MIGFSGGPCTSTGVSTLVGAAVTLDFNSIFLPITGLFYDRATADFYSSTFGSVGWCSCEVGREGSSLLTLLDYNMRRPHETMDACRMEVARFGCNTS